MKRKSIILVILMLAVGFAAISTTLYLNGQISVVTDINDYNVYFSKVIENGSENNTLIVDKTHIKFNGELSDIEETYELRYTVTNGSKNYDASVTMNCTGGNDYLSVENTFDTTKELIAGENREGILTIKVIKSTIEDITANIVCEITAGAVERTSLGDGESMSGTVYGVRRSRDSYNTTWERVESSVGLTANATKNGSAVQNDFDSIYPWSDIITYNYDPFTKTEKAQYGDANFKFDGSNGLVLTRIPSFYYKRTISNNYEYIYISSEEQEGFTKSEAFSVGRYTSSWYEDKLTSRSGEYPATEMTITDFRTYSRQLGSDFGQLDYHYFILQLLYLVEYADYNSQKVLGQGNTNNSEAIASGGCDRLGMKSGSVRNDGVHSVIYRGIEDIFGNIWQYIDGINIRNYQAYVNYNPKTYVVDRYSGDYQKLGYINAKLDGYVTHLGYDANHPLVSLPISVGGDENTYMSDFLWQVAEDRITLVGGMWFDSTYCGLWFWDFGYASSDADIYYGARLLRTS